MLGYRPPHIGTSTQTIQALGYRSVNKLSHSLLNNQTQLNIFWSKTRFCLKICFLEPIEMKQKKESETLKAIIVDDHLMVAQAIATVISIIADIQLIGIATSVRDACKLINEKPPDILILDINLEHGDHLEIATYLVNLKPCSKIILISGFTRGYIIPTYLKENIIAVVDKASPWEGLESALSPWREDMHIYESSAIDKTTLSKIKSLPKRVSKVFLEIGKGLDNKEIALSLGLTKNTVESYRKVICTTIGVSGSQLVRIAALYSSISWFNQE